MTLTGPGPTFLLSNKLKNFEALLLAFNEMCAAFNELKTCRHRRKDSMESGRHRLPFSVL